MTYLLFFIVGCEAIAIFYLSIFYFFVIINGLKKYFQERKRLSKFAPTFGIQRKFLETNESLKIRMRNAICGKYSYPRPNETINCRCVTVCVEGIAPIKKN